MSLDPAPPPADEPADTGEPPDDEESSDGDDEESTDTDDGESTDSDGEESTDSDDEESSDSDDEESSDSDDEESSRSDDEESSDTDTEEPNDTEESPEASDAEEPAAADDPAAEDGETLDAAGENADNEAGSGNVGDLVEPCSSHPLLGFALPEESGSKGKTAVKKTVTAKLVEIWFRYDHTVGDPNTKLLRPSPGDFKDTASSFTKPEWNESGKNDPVSTTMNNNLVVDLVIDFTVTPAGQTVSLTQIQGSSGDPCLNFERSMTDTVGTERRIIYWLQSKDKTPDSVQRISDSVTWSVTANGKPIPLGTTGPHLIYSTFARPWGKMKHLSTGFTQTGSDQDVTEERLKFAVTCASGKKTDRECVDGVFNRFSALGLHYTLGNRWPDTTPPTMTLHHYLWKVANGELLAECHMLAAAFIMVAEMIGVPGPFDIGYMYPSGRRDGTHPYPPRAAPVYGKYSVPDTRSHTIVNSWLPNENHGDERMCFVDSHGLSNNFEGVAMFKGRTLYAIGDSILDKFPTGDENSSDWYKGANFDLFFTRGEGNPKCDEPYPPAVKKERFKWSD